MAGTCRSLIDVLAEVPDPRKPRGQRHPLASILALAVVATLCGYKSYAAIAEWGRNYGADFVRALGFRRQKSPCASTLFYIFQQIDRQAFEDALAAWAHAALAAAPPPKGKLEPIAIDGKTLRGSKQQGACDVHLLSALSHRLGLTLFQQGVSDKTNEIGAIQEVLQALVLEGRVVTVDALLCQRAVAQTILSRGGTM
jgi:DDE family transposase